MICQAEEKKIPAFYTKKDKGWQWRNVKRDVCTDL